MKSYPIYAVSSNGSILKEMSFDVSHWITDIIIESIAFGLNLIAIIITIFLCPGIIRVMSILKAMGACLSCLVSLLKTSMNLGFLVGPSKEDEEEEGPIEPIFKDMHAYRAFSHFMYGLENFTRNVGHCLSFVLIYELHQFICVTKMRQFLMSKVLKEILFACLALLTVIIAERSAYSIIFTVNYIFFADEILGTASPLLLLAVLIITGITFYHAVKILLFLGQRKPMRRENGEIGTVFIMVAVFLVFHVIKLVLQLARTVKFSLNFVNLRECPIEKGNYAAASKCLTDFTDSFFLMTILNKDALLNFFELTTINSVMAFKKMRARRQEG